MARFENEDTDRVEPTPVPRVPALVRTGVAAMAASVAACGSDDGNTRTGQTTMGGTGGLLAPMAPPGGSGGDVIAPMAPPGGFGGSGAIEAPMIAPMVPPMVAGPEPPPVGSCRTPSDCGPEAVCVAPWQPICSGDGACTDPVPDPSAGCPNFAPCPDGFTCVMYAGSQSETYVCERFPCSGPFDCPDGTSCIQPDPPQTGRCHEDFGTCVVIGP